MRRKRLRPPYLQGTQAMAEEKLFGKYNDFVLLVLGFVLSGVVGSYIAQQYTRKSSETQVATDIFKDEIKLVGDRIFLMNQVFIHLQDRKQSAPETEEELRNRWSAYREVLQRWNSARSFNREMLRLYFGEKIWQQERALHYSLRAWGGSLEAQYKTPGSIDMKCLQSKRDEILVMAHDFGLLLAESIKEGRIGYNSQNALGEKEEMLDVFCKAEAKPIGQAGRKLPPK